MIIRYLDPEGSLKTCKDMIAAAAEDAGESYEQPPD